MKGRKSKVNENLGPSCARSGNPAWMGSCYSCKSGKRPATNTYTTVPMANTDRTMDETTASPAGAKRTSPYTRGSSTSFGFNKRRIPTTLRSLTQDRTSELVNNYEAKIANINANNVSNATTVVGKASPKHSNNSSPKHNKTSNNRLQYSHIPRFGYKANSTSSLASSEDFHSSNSSLNNGDPNSNSVIVVERYPQNNKVGSNAATGVTNGLKYTRLPEPSSRIAATNKISKPKPSTSVVGKRGSRENSPELHHRMMKVGKSQPEKPTTPTKNRKNQTQKTALVLPAPVRQEYVTTGIKLPSKVTTHVSGLPKPQIAIVSGSRIGNNNNKKQKEAANDLKSNMAVPPAPLAQFDEVEAMHLSSDTLPEEENFILVDLDSGLGMSESDKEKVVGEGDNETLGEVSELASDTVSVGRNSKERTPEKKSVSRSPPKQQKTTVGPPTAPRPNGLQLRQLTSRSGTRSRPEDLGKKIASRFNQEDDFSVKTDDDFSISSDYNIETVQLVPVFHLTDQEHNLSSSDSDKTYTGITKLDNRLVVGTSPGQDLTEKQLGTRQPVCRESPNLMEPETERHQEKGVMDASVTSVGSAASQPDSLPGRGGGGGLGGPISPPSERDQFLIDDEIADQPDLIACESTELRRFLNSTQDFYCRDQDLFLEGDGNEGMATFRADTGDMLSSSSSISSGDMMLDFDQTEDGDNSARRLSGGGEEGAFDPTDRMKAKEYHQHHHRHRSRSLRLADSSYEVIDELNCLLDSHSKDGQPRSRRSRAATTSDVSSPSSSTTSDVRTLRPPRQMTATELEEDGGVIIDRPFHRSMEQDVTNLKTMLLKLKRVIQESETINPFESHSWKNGLFHNLAHNDPPIGCRVREDSESDGQALHEEITQENTDLRRQVVFLQQQLDEKDRTIRLLQQQMTKYTNSAASVPEEKDTINAATQTDKPRLSLTSMSQSCEDSPCGTTVSSNGKAGNGGGSLDHTNKKELRRFSSPDVTRSLTSLPSTTVLANPPPQAASQTARLCSNLNRTFNLHDKPTLKGTLSKSSTGEASGLTTIANPSKDVKGQLSLRQPTNRQNNDRSNTTESRIAVRVPSFRVKKNSTTTSAAAAATTTTTAASTTAISTNQKSKPVVAVPPGGSRNNQSVRNID